MTPPPPHSDTPYNHKPNHKVNHKVNHNDNEFEKWQEQQQTELPLQQSNSLKLVASNDKAKKKVADGTLVFNAYAESYEKIYGVIPKRDAKTNAQAKKIIDTLGLDDAIAVAGAFPHHVDSWYCKKMHDFGLLLADAKGLWVQYKTQNMRTSQDARLLEKQGLAARLKAESDEYGEFE